MVKYYPKNYIPIYGGGKSLLHFILRCLFCRALYVKNLEFRENDNQVLFESEKEFFSDKKYRGDVFDPFTSVLYEIQKR